MGDLHQTLLNIALFFFSLLIIEIWVVFFKIAFIFHSLVWKFSFQGLIKPSEPIAAKKALCFVVETAEEGLESLSLWLLGKCVELSSESVEGREEERPDCCSCSHCHQSLAHPFVLEGPLGGALSRTTAPACPSRCIKNLLSLSSLLTPNRTLYFSCSKLNKMHSVQEKTSG